MYVEARKRLVNWLRNQLIGPAGEGSLRMSPLDRYPTGVLHPIDPGSSGVDPAAEPEGEIEPALYDDGEDADGDEEEDGEPLARPVRRRRYVPPSSVGFSFYMRGTIRLAITASAAVYLGTRERDEDGRFQHAEYRRSELPETAVEWSGSALVAETSHALWDDGAYWTGRAGIDVRARPHFDGRIVTVTLCNRTELNRGAAARDHTRARVEKALFEARLDCLIESGELLEYPRADLNLLTEEEQELELQYRKQRIHAVGHGAAVGWETGPGGRPRIRSDFMPAAEVPMVTVDSAGRDAVFELARHSEGSMTNELAQFVDGYDDWIAAQEHAASSLGNTAEEAAAGRICERMRTARDRMRGSIEMLRSDPFAAESFRLANLAMLDQMRQADRIRRRDAENRRYRWRPFQLAFLLTTLASAIRDNDDYRNVLDLIWFPTGGGKTEAYLGLIALLIVWRRLQHTDSGAGTAAFMRYTLRLLTRQQFERAARMICALELIRRRDAARLGSAPIDIGIWVGEAISPNSFAGAREIVNEIRSGKSEARYKLLLERCPWCETPFDGERGYRAEDENFCFRCVSPACEFGGDDGRLPCNVVDEALYEHPPSLLIGTIDKFARVAWEERAGVFFGAGGNRPPELIIQDELHLITGPLGSIAGLYEAGFDTLLARRGVRPKYIASTATVRMAEVQVRRLYARDLAVFPPPGLSHDDTYFARTDHERPGRLYVGYLAPTLDQQHCLAPLAAALLAAPQTLFEDDANRDTLLDAWWTQVIYHGSLKGVGNSHNAFVTDVRDFGKRLAGELDEARAAGVHGDRDAAAADPDGLPARLRNARIAQLTSRRTAAENAETFQRLASTRDRNDYLDTVLATNMVSVGLDVARLALMIVNGQPLTTGEYIQATSRVGRGQVPGLVLVNYYRHQPRSLSHYESFRPYHESFYRFVEPGSVTPFTVQVRTRALHAALVIALRHACVDLQRNAAAGRFDRHAPEVAAALDELKRRCARAADGTGQDADTAAHIERLADEWHDEAGRCRQARRQLSYQAGAYDKGADRLLYAHGAQHPGLWATLNSMRNVEGTGALRVHDWPPRQRRRSATGPPAAGE